MIIHRKSDAAATAVSEAEQTHLAAHGSSVTREQGEGHERISR